MKPICEEINPFLIDLAAVCRVDLPPLRTLKFLTYVSASIANGLEPNREGFDQFVLMDADSSVEDVEAFMQAEWDRQDPDNFESWGLAFAEMAARDPDLLD